MTPLAQIGHHVTAMGSCSSSVFVSAEATVSDSKDPGISSLTIS